MSGIGNTAYIICILLFFIIINAAESETFVCIIMYLFFNVGINVFDTNVWRHSITITFCSIDFTILSDPNTTKE